MSAPRRRVDPPRLALTRAEAAASLGMSPSHFDRHVKAGLPVIYSGDLTLYPVYGLDEWARKNSTIGGRRAA